MAKAAIAGIAVLALILSIVALVQSKSVSLPPKPNKAECGALSDEERFDCYPEIGASQELCEARGCCWVPAKKQSLNLDVPYCFFPQDYRGYEYINRTDTENGQLAYLKRSFPSSYPRDVQTLKLEVEYQTNERVRVKISDAENARFEPQWPKIENKMKKAADNPLYSVEIDTEQSGFKVTRKDGSVIFNSQNVGPFIFADQFLQMSSLYNGDIYGIGEHRTTLLLDNKWAQFSLWGRDAAPSDNANLYGSHPFYLVVEPDGKSYGVFLHNSNAMDILLQPLPAITFRPIGGIFDFYFFVGPTPADVVRQYTEVIGRTFLPPYWSLGFQLCKYGYGTSDETRRVWERNREAGIPYDVQWNDIDYMITQNDFTIDPNNFGGIYQLVDDIHAAGMHYVPILDPGVSASEPSGTYPPYEDGIEMDIFVKDKDGKVFIAKVWNPVSTAFPDFTNPKSQEYWTKQIRELYAKLPFDGIWIDMNEPANFLDGSFEGCPDDELEHPPYATGIIGGILYGKTLCSTAQHYAGRHYDVHNLYGISEAERTQTALEEIIGKRAFVLSRSTYAGSGRYTAHWTGDINSNWDDLAKSIPAILQSNMYGMNVVGADICGFNGDTNHNLCNRWMQLGAFYPFSRNHNSIGRVDQDPAALGDDIIASSKKALNIRYTLLPYLYTLLYQAHVNGDTVARPLFFEFPEDPNARAVDKAFLWGSGLYIIPVIEDNQEQVTTYLPAGKWYDWYTNEVHESTGADVTLAAPSDTIPLLIRGGNVLPTHEPAVTTTLARKNDFAYLVALDASGNANGGLFWDDGDSIGTVENNQYGLVNINVSNKKLTATADVWNSPETPNLRYVVILGVSDEVNQVTVNGQQASFEIDGQNRLVVQDIGLPVSTSLTIEW